jgi:hypothetical protein
LAVLWKGSDDSVTTENEITSFLSETKTPSATYFSCVVWLQQLAYLTDNFSKLNKFNLLIQGCSITAFTAEDKAATVKVKFIFCRIG